MNKSVIYRFLYVFLFVFSQGNIVSQENPESELSGNITKAAIDLNKATGDHRIYVEITPPVIKSETVEYHFPKIVPGTYVINNFGRFISDFKALDKNGNKLKTEQLDTNRWLIYGADNLGKINYYAEDSYHSNKKPSVFEPIGLCIDSGKVFVLNNFCYVGYFNGYKDLPFTLSVTKPVNFYGSTSLPLVYTSETTDLYRARSYFELHDNPILYSVPDTATVMINNTKVLISVYSPGKKVNSAYLLDHTKKLFEAQGKYLGGELPADKYSILVYLFEGSSKSGSAGALEHFKSTAMCYPEVNREDFTEPFQDVVSHEFFHIITPLGIHSEEVHDFDFINPKMSKHLWLYEGSTEYYAQHSQVKYGVVTVNRFFEKMQQKILISTAYFNDTLPFTELSLSVLNQGWFHSQYINVYLKGALISMCLDLELLRLSGGKYGLQDLKKDLMIMYGPKKPFKDHELFDVITSITYPEIRIFFSDYVEGSKKLPYRQFLGYAGYDYVEKYERKAPAMIGAALSGGQEGKFTVTEVKKFGELLKLKKGDIIFSVNGKEITTANLKRESEEFESTVKEGDEVTVVVLRKGAGGKLEEKTLKAKTFYVKYTEEYKIIPLDSPGAEQLEIRKAWLNQ